MQSRIFHRHVLADAKDSSQGNLLGQLEFRYEFVKDLVREVVPKYHITVEDLPPSDDFVGCRKFEAKLSQDHTRFDILDGSKDLLPGPGDAEEHSGEGSSQDMDAEKSEGSINLVCVARFIQRAHFKCELLLMRSHYHKHREISLKRH